MKQNDLGVVVLAAGRGTRMKSDKPKVLHTVNGRSMLSWVLESAVDVAGKNVVVVVGHQSEKVKKDISAEFDVSFELQRELIGTGDAVRSALPGLSHDVKDVLILCGDVPLIRKKTLLETVAFHKKNQNDITVLAVNLDNPSDYGRIILDKKKEFLCIREEADASVEEKRVVLVNSGIYCVKKDFLVWALEFIKPDNVQKEYYFTDIVAIAKRKGNRAGYVAIDNCQEVFGVNTISELQQVEQLMREMDL
ncbi:MAG: NTP transferase domain-containing protein [Thermodesulfobacteriota bacterium]|nr:NTP transferase domain-containing protein [Thermodesulfobacteriota bacterium]